MLGDPNDLADGVKVEFEEAPNPRRPGMTLARGVRVVKLAAAAIRLRARAGMAPALQVACAAPGWREGPAPFMVDTVNEIGPEKNLTSKL